MLRKILPLLCALALFACGDDDSTTDASVADAATDDATTNDAATNDASTGDASSEDADTPDTSTSECFALSGATVDIPFASPVTFTEASPTWMAPGEPSCPATTVLTDATPFEAICYRHDGDAPAEFRFEVAPENEESVSITAYAGESVPADVTACAAADAPILGLAEVTLVMEPGQAVTIVGSLQDTGETGSIQIIAGPSDD